MPATLTALNPSTGVSPRDQIVVTGTGFVLGATVVYTAGALTLTDAAPSVVSGGEIRSVVPDVLQGEAGTATVTVVQASVASNGLALGLIAWPDIAEIYPLASIAKLKTLMGVTRSDTKEDAKYAAAIAGASAAMVMHLRQDFRVHTFTDELYDGTGEPVLYVRRRPLIAITGLKIDGAVVDTGELKVYEDYIAFEDGGDYNARLRSSVRIFPQGRLNIALSGSDGYSKVPAAVGHGCLMQAMFLLNTAQKQGLLSQTFADKGGLQQMWSQQELCAAAKAAVSEYSPVKMAVV